MRYTLIYAIFLSPLVAAQGSGPYAPAGYSTISSLSDHTIYQPRTIPSGAKFPVLIWANGACGLNGLAFQNFLNQIASHGFFVIANGGPNGNSQAPTGSNGMQTTVRWFQSSLDWLGQNAGKGSYTYVDGSKIAAGGQSCGGLDVYGVKTDSRISALGIFNSGWLDAGQSYNTVSSITKPIFYFLGGSGDIAYQNGERDYGNLPKSIPAWKGNLPVGHDGTYWDGDGRGGKFGIAASRWLQWVLNGDPNGASFFTGSGARNDGWSVVSQNLGNIPTRGSTTTTTTSTTTSRTTTPSQTTTTTTVRTTTPQTTTTTRTSTSGGGGTQSQWGQCGGIGWTGPTACASPYTCNALNPYYSQCL